MCVSVCVCACVREIEWTKRRKEETEHVCSFNVRLNSRAAAWKSKLIELNWPESSFRKRDIMMDVKVCIYVYVFVCV